MCLLFFFFFFSSRRRHTRSDRDWSSDVCSSDLVEEAGRRPEPGDPGQPGPLLLSRLADGLGEIRISLWGSGRDVDELGICSLVARILVTRHSTRRHAGGRMPKRVIAPE